MAQYEDRLDQVSTQEEEKLELSNGIVITMRPAHYYGETMLWIDNYAGTKVHVLNDSGTTPDYEMLVNKPGCPPFCDPLVKYVKVTIKDTLPNGCVQYRLRVGCLLYKTPDDPHPTIQVRVSDMEKWIAACARA